MTSALIVAAGRSTRMGPQIDKLFLDVAGQPVIAHTWRQFEAAACIDDILFVVRDGFQTAFTAVAEQGHFQKPFRFALGGPERQDSVWNGLQALAPECQIVVIQDGARPCTTAALIAATIRKARETGAAVAAQRITDTLKESDGVNRIVRTVDRTRLWAVQTPQTFRVEVIKRALAAVRQEHLHITDDTAACEWVGQPVQLVESPAPNPKVTSPADLPLVEALLRGQGK